MLGRVHVNRNTASVILNTTDIIPFQGNGNRIAVSSHGFIDTVINNLIHKMMKSVWSCRTDIHTRSLSNSFQTL